VVKENKHPKQQSRTELLSHLGRNHLILRNDEAVLRISWSVVFDWTGEAESDVSASAAFSQTCKYRALPFEAFMLIFLVDHDMDSRESLKKVSMTFSRLVRSKGVFGAIDAMVSLVFP
jgi:hypothetical protein